MIKGINIGIIVDLYPGGIWHETGIGFTQSNTITCETTATTCNLKNSKVQVAKNILICSGVTTNNRSIDCSNINTNPT